MIGSDQLALLDELGEQWPDSAGKEELRAHWLDDGRAVVAPFNVRIRPGMAVVAELRAGAVDTASVPEGSRATLHWVLLFASTADPGTVGREDGGLR
jgi:hypothetical protein